MQNSVYTDVSHCSLSSRLASSLIVRKLWWEWGRKSFETGAKTKMKTDAAETQPPPCEVCGKLSEYKREEQWLVKRMAVLRRDHTCTSSNSFSSLFLFSTLYSPCKSSQFLSPPCLLWCDLVGKSWLRPASPSSWSWCRSSVHSFWCAWRSLSLQRIAGHTSCIVSSRFVLHVILFLMLYCRPVVWLLNVLHITICWQHLQHVYSVEPARQVPSSGTHNRLPWNLSSLNMLQITANDKVQMLTSPPFVGFYKGTDLLTQKFRLSQSRRLQC